MSMCDSRDIHEFIEVCEFVSVQGTMHLVSIIVMLNVVAFAPRDVNAPRGLLLGAATKS